MMLMGPQRIDTALSRVDNVTTALATARPWRYLSTPVCNLYSLNKKRDAVARFFRASHNRTVAFEPLSAIFPGHIAPVVRQTADGERETVLMSWGFVLPQRDKAPRRVTNVRDDKILESR